MSDSQDEVDAAVARYAGCRGPIGHLWTLIRSESQPTHPSGAVVVFTCDACGMGRRMAFDRETGRMLVHHYKLPPDYRLVGKHDADWWRKAWADAVFGPLKTASNVVSIKRRKKK